MFLYFILFLVVGENDKFEGFGLNVVVVVVFVVLLLFFILVVVVVVFFY